MPVRRIHPGEELFAGAHVELAFDFRRILPVTGETFALQNRMNLFRKERPGCPLRKPCFLGNLSSERSRHHRQKQNEVSKHVSFVICRRLPIVTGKTAASEKSPP